MSKRNYILIFLLNIVLTFNCFGQVVRYTTADLNVRKGPSKSYASLGIVPVGTQVNISDYNYYENEWLAVVYNGQTGYISTKYLSSQKVLQAKSNNGTPWTSKSSSGYTTRSNTYSGSNGYYRNVDGNWIPRPQYSDTRPAGATAICRDGTYSFSAPSRGTCWHHGGVKVWLN